MSADDNAQLILLAAMLVTMAVTLVLILRAITARDRAEVQASALASVLDGEAQARLLVDADGNWIYANQAARALFGYGLPDRSLVARLPDDETARDALQRLRVAAQGGFPERLELPLLPAGSSAVDTVEWWDIAVRPVEGRRGERVWSASDVTARRAIEDILVREREDLAEFLWFVPVGLYSADAGGHLGFVNQPFAEMLGYTSDDLLGRSLDDLTVEGTAPEVEGVWRGEVTFLSRYGEAISALVVQSTYDDAGQTRTRSVVVRDGLVAPGEDGPEPTDTRFRWLFDAAPMGLAVLDLDGVVIDANPALERMAGISREALIDQPLASILVSEERLGLDSLMQRVALGREDTVTREVQLMPAGDPSVADTAAAMTLAPMGHGAGIDGLIVHFIDTTAQRNLEAQFAQAQKMQAMGQLAGGVAHDFNNLLTAMIGFCDLLLQRHGAGDPSFADLMQIKQNSNRAANLVRQLLAFSRKQPLKPRLVDVGEVLTELSHLLRRLIGETVQFDMRLGREAGLVRVDPGQLDQVIINLVVNARDAMPGGGQVSIRTRAEVVATPFTRGPEHVPAGNYVMITVTDTGTGIARENLGRIFEPFFSTKSSTAGAGTGLGLSTVYGIIRQTGGFVFVDSTPGRGTAFTIYLPRHDAAEDLQVEEERRRSPRGAAPPALRPDDAEDSLSAAPPPALPPSATDPATGGTILLVEDEDPVRIFAARALRNKGYTVIEARTGEGALDLLQDHPEVILLVTDMVMPGMNGATLARLVRQEHQAMQVILISGYSEEAARGELTESPDFHFLPKPFSLAQLADKVRDVLASVPPAG